MSKDYIGPFGPESIKAANERMENFRPTARWNEGGSRQTTVAVISAAVSALDREALTRTIYGACFDPGRHVQRRSAESDFGGKDYEHMDLWRARAVIAALFPTGGGAG